MARPGRSADSEPPDVLNVIAACPIAPVFGARRPQLAQEFVACVHLPEEQAILGDNGFLPIMGGSEQQATNGDGQ